MKTWKVRLAILLGILAAVYLGVCVRVLVLQEELLFDPTPVSQTAPMLGEEVYIPVGTGGDKLHACWVSASGTDAPTVLYLHGKTHNNSTHQARARWLQRLNCNVLMADYRGFGKSSGGGKPSEVQVYEDAEAAWSYLTHERRIKPDHAFIYGHSLGAAIAIELATHHPEAAGLVAESAFTSAPLIGKYKYPYLPTGWLLRMRFDSLQKVGTLKLPVLLIHGTLDEKVPFKMSKDLYAAAPEPKKLLLIEGAGHANCPEVGGAECDAAVTTFVRTQPQSAPTHSKAAP